MDLRQRDRLVAAGGEGEGEGEARQRRPRAERGHQWAFPATMRERMPAAVWPRPWPASLITEPAAEAACGAAEAAALVAAPTWLCIQRVAPASSVAAPPPMARAMGTIARLFIAAMVNISPALTSWCIWPPKSLALAPVAAFAVRIWA